MQLNLSSLRRQGLPFKYCCALLHLELTSLVQAELGISLTVSECLPVALLPASVKEEQPV
jgi:hypothetical protein